MARGSAISVIDPSNCELSELLIARNLLLFIFLPAVLVISEVDTMLEKREDSFKFDTPLLLGVKSISMAANIPAPIIPIPMKNVFLLIVLLPIVTLSIGWSGAIPPK